MSRSSVTERQDDEVFDLKLAKEYDAKLSCQGCLCRCTKNWSDRHRSGGALNEAVFATSADVDFWR